MNVTWADYVLGEFPNDEAFARVTLVEDPDTLLADETIFAALPDEEESRLESTSNFSAW